MLMAFEMSSKQPYHLPFLSLCSSGTSPFQQCDEQSAASAVAASAAPHVLEYRIDRDTHRLNPCLLPDCLHL
jgi:hypothetical protein